MAEKSIAMQAKALWSTVKGERRFLFWHWVATLYIAIFSPLLPLLFAKIVDDLSAPNTSINLIFAFLGLAAILTSSI